MTFDINQLDTLDYEEAESWLPAYLEGMVEQFAQSPEGEVYVQEHPEFGRWISTFTKMAYLYEGFTLSQMTRGDMQIVMEHLLPRKITLADPADAEDTIPELVAFWEFLKREYNLHHAGAIVTYLTSIKGKFTDWMFDPAKGGMAKSFIISGMQAGFDMTTKEGLEAFQLAYNEQLLAETPKSSFLQKLGKLFQGSAPPAQLPPSSPKASQQKPKTTIKGFEMPAKGFEVPAKGKKARQKKK